MKTIILLLLVAGGMLKVSAQDMYASIEKSGDRTTAVTTTKKVAEKTEMYQWEFWSAEESGPLGNCSKSIEALYGKEVGYLLSLMDNCFIRRERVDAGDPSLKTSVRKPAIYNAVKNIEKFYKQKNKRNNYTVTDGETFAYVVKVALASVDTEDTESFEQALQDFRKDADGQIACFRRVKLKNIYE